MRTRGHDRAITTPGSRPQLRFSGIEFAVFQIDAVLTPRTPYWNGSLQGLCVPAPNFDKTGGTPFEIELDIKHPCIAALQLIRERVVNRLDDGRVAASVHRVARGGNHYFALPVLTPEILGDLYGHPSRTQTTELARSRAMSRRQMHQSGRFTSVAARIL